MSSKVKARRKLKLCVQCGKAVAKGARLCIPHLLADRERKRKAGGWEARVEGGRGRPAMEVEDGDGGGVQRES